MYRKSKAMLAVACVALGVWPGVQVVRQAPALAQPAETQSADQSDAKEPRDSQPESVGDRPSPLRATEEARVRAREQWLAPIAGEHVLRIEIQADPGEGGQPLLVNGQPVDRRTAMMLIDFIRSRELSAGERDEDGHARNRWLNERRNGRDRSGGPFSDRDRGTGSSWAEQQIRQDELSLEFIDTAMQVIRDFEPQMYGTFKEMQEDEDRRFESQLRRLAFRYLREIELKRSDPESYDLRLEDHQLELALKRVQLDLAWSSDGEDMDVGSYREQLREIMLRRFEIEYEMKMQEVTRFAERIESLKTRLTERKEKAEQEVETRVDRILEDALQSRDDR